MPTKTTIIGEVVHFPLNISSGDKLIIQNKEIFEFTKNMTFQTEEALKEFLIEKNICCECGRDLPIAIREQRDCGHSEMVTICSNCGATYTN